MFPFSLFLNADCMLYFVPTGNNKQSKKKKQTKKTLISDKYKSATKA